MADSPLRVLNSSIIEPARTTVMIKPVGALCNLDCTYCYYLPTKDIFDGHEHRMKLDTLESIFASLMPRFADEVTIAWQGGEPTLAGLPFFEKAIEFQEKHRRPNQIVRHALQTNCTLIDDKWCKFLRDNRFLVGCSVDGPANLHNRYRVTNRGDGSHDAVMRGLRKIDEHGVERNILCVLNNVNVHHPDEVFRYMLNLGERWIQFIPCIEWEPDPDRPGENRLATYSPDPIAYGEFLRRVFDLWFERHRTQVSIRIIDVVLNKLVLDFTPLCIHDEACHRQLTIEHDGAVFGCDHFVERRWQLGQIGDERWANEINLDGSQNVGLTFHGTGLARNAEHHVGRDIDNPDDMSRYDPDGLLNGSVRVTDDGADQNWFDRLDLERLTSFSERKQRLPDKCLACEYKPFCHGGCPKHRSQGGETPEPTILCEGYLLFYRHAMEKLEWLASYLRRNQQPPPPGHPDDPWTGRDTHRGWAPRPVAVGSSLGSFDPSMTSAAASERGAIEAAAPDAANPNAGEARANLSRPPAPAPIPAPVSPGKVGRNDPCPCGSGVKFKKCCGR